MTAWRAMRQLLKHIPRIAEIWTLNFRIARRRAHIQVPCNFRCHRRNRTGVTVGSASERLFVSPVDQDDHAITKHLGTEYERGVSPVGSLGHSDFITRIRQSQRGLQVRAGIFPRCAAVLCVAVVIHIPNGWSSMIPDVTGALQRIRGTFPTPQAAEPDRRRLPRRHR